MHRNILLSMENLALAEHQAGFLRKRWLILRGALPGPIVQAEGTAGAP